MRNCPLRVTSLVLLGLTANVLVIPAVASRPRQSETTPTGDTITVTKAIPAPVEYRFSRNVGAGRLVKVAPGKPGKVVRTYEVTRKDGKIVKKEMVSEVRVDAEPIVFNMGRAGWPTASRGFSRGRVLTMRASAYTADPSENGGSGRVKLGWRAGYGQVAVDPRVIPLGSLVYIEGYGFAIASDIGSAIKGNRIDLCMSSNSQAMAFGRRTVRVHVMRRR